VTKSDVREMAEAKFKKKEMQALDARKATAEYDAARRALSENTARLRALRLARDAAAELAASENKALVSVKKKAKTRRD
jgi:transcription elongation GreA/GreB family factor